MGGDLGRPFFLDFLPWDLFYVLYRSFVFSLHFISFFVRVCVRFARSLKWDESEIFFFFRLFYECGILLTFICLRGAGGGQG